MSEDEVNSQFYNTINVNFDQEIKTIQNKIASLDNKLKNDYSTSATKQLNAQINAEENAIKQLEDKIKDCTVLAVCDGFVLDLPIEHQSEVAEGDVIAEIKGEDRFVVEVKVLTDKAPYLKIGDRVEIIQRLKDENLTYEGNISAIYNYAEKSVSALGLDEYKVKVVVDMEKASTLNDGYEADVKFFTANAENSISVANSAIFTVDDENYVFLIKDNKAIQQKVETGHKANVRTEIVSGLNEGDTIIEIANTEGISDGVDVSIVQ